MNFKEFSDYATGKPIMINLDNVTHIGPSYDGYGDFICCYVLVQGGGRILVTESYILMRNLLGGK